MSMFTPGPWSTTHSFSAITAGNRQLARVYFDIVSYEECEANARLIAAAPDLLAACKAALGAFENNDAIDWGDLGRAIAKAEGRSG